MPQPQWPFVGAEALRARQVSERAMRNTYEQIYPGSVRWQRGCGLNAEE